MQNSNITNMFQPNGTNKKATKPSSAVNNVSQGSITKSTKDNETAPRSDPTLTEEVDES